MHAFMVYWTYSNEDPFRKEDPYRMKKLTICLLSLLALLMLAACTNTEDFPEITDDMTDGGVIGTSSVTDAPAEHPTEPTAETEAPLPETEAPETEEATTVFTPPVADPEEAAATGLPLDDTDYTLGSAAGDEDASAQYAFIKAYANAYEGKQFTLYGNVTKDDYGNVVVLVGEEMGFAVYFEGMSEPIIGSRICVTATFEKRIDMGTYVDFLCYTMVASDWEQLGEAVGPNGGRYMFITASSLNVRTTSDTSTSDNILGQLSFGEMVEVFEQDAKGWYRIVFKGQNAYISNKYVSETAP